MANKAAFIGLGVMGYPMAGHLASAGHSVSVYNRTKAKAEQWQKEHKGTAFDTPREAADGADIVMICVGNDDDLRSVVYGDDGVLAGLASGAILVDHTTASASVARENFRCVWRKKDRIYRRTGVWWSGRCREWRTCNYVWW